MRKLRSVLCVLCLLLLVPALMRARRILPLDTQALVAEKYVGWTGVLRLWVHEGWPCGSGSIAAWLNRCISEFEKGHPGVYVQPQFVDAGAIATMNDSGILPPDMLLVPPGLLTTGTGLLPLDAPVKLRPALQNCGLWDGATYAVPFALGGYLWAWTAGLIDALPDSWADTDAALAIPAPETFRRWDAALLALCSGRYAPSAGETAPQHTPPMPGEVELGLAGGETPIPTASPQPRTDETLSRRLPEDFQYDSDAWRHFINGEAAAIPVTQREIRRLQALSETGKGPDWRLSRGDNPFTDQLLCLAIVDKPDAEPQRELCAAFLSWLLADECQSRLCLASAFAVTDIPSGYAQSDPLCLLDDALRDPSLRVPRIFDEEWTGRGEAIVRAFTSGEGEAPALWARYCGLLAKKVGG